ncbi:MAG TPA: hypothetical protein PK948_07480, partial [Gemmatimonadales bacterium]|nr:hypothetical protein [Gemmatimonadales bacterium]
MATARNRGLVWLTALAAALALAVAIAGFRDVLPRVFALLGLALFAACLVLVAHALAGHPFNLGSPKQLQ